MTRIEAPVGAAAYGRPGPGGEVFDEHGVFHTDNSAIIAYCRGTGYGIDGPPPVRNEVVPMHVDRPARYAQPELRATLADQAARDAEKKLQTATEASS